MRSPIQPARSVIVVSVKRRGGQLEEARCGDRTVLVAGWGRPRMTVPLAELNGGDEGHGGIAVLEGMVLHQVRAEHGRLRREVRVEVLPAEAGQRCVEGRISQMEAGLLGDALGRHREHRLGDQEEVGQLQRPDRVGFGR